MTGRSADIATPVPMLRMVVVVVCAAAALAGVLATSPAATVAAVRQAGGELAMLLRFMAGVKALMAAAFVALTTWRLGYPASGRLAAVYVVSAALMSAAPGVIFQMAHVAAGAVLFHVGLLVQLGAAWADRGGRARVVAAVMARRRAAPA